MSPLWGHLNGVVTVVLMTLFIGIWIWAWRARHQRVFTRMAHLPMEDELDGSAAGTPVAEPEDRP